MITDTIQQEECYVLNTYNRPPFVLIRGEGITVYDTTGKAYLDFGSGIAVTALGHSDPEMIAVIQEQAAQLSHVSNLYHTAPHAELAEMLCRTSFADKVFFCNSGSEAVESAIKFARKYACTEHGPGKTGIVAFHGGFHGRTVGALALTAREKYQAPFRPLMPRVSFAPFNDVEAAAKLISPETCAVIVEPVQGEGGIHVATQEFLEGLRTLCDRYDALLIFDEIQCGVGRTGRLWAYEHFGVEPDIMTAAKALGGGLPIGAALVTDEVAQVMTPGDHGSTFAAGPIASRAAQVVLRRVNDPAMLAHINDMSKLLVSELNALDSPHITEIRAFGLMIGIELDIEAASVIQKGHEMGVLLIHAGPNVLRLLPPYIVQPGHIDQLINILREIL